VTAQPGGNGRRQPAWGPDGLVPVVVQDDGDGRVLMVAYTDAEALEATLRTGELHFHSRSRGRLWRKGETSGHVLHLVDLAPDCDGDALLARVHPAGPTCHRGTRSCFDQADGTTWGASGAARDAGPAPAAVTQGFDWLETLWATITDRRARRPAGSYTAALLKGGVDAAGRMVTVEATEVLLAAKDDASAEALNADRAATRAALAGEAADLLFHTLVLLAERDLDPGAAILALRARHGPGAGRGSVREAADLAAASADPDLPPAAADRLG
jgi:phosphoribosyl-ATP pyrophosphohydrolase/phosphoribosyl-AMP cyclohydrolase